MIFLRSLLFNTAFMVWTALMCVGLLWILLLPRNGTMAVIRWYLRSIAWMERTFLGLHYEVRGLENVPATGSFIIAAKHQSAWETMKLHLIFHDPAVILKRELTWIPTWGWYARKSRMIAVDRGARGRALTSMVENSRPVVAEGRPIVIFPQGTRVAPGAYSGYRVGAGVLYDELKLPMLPVALNAGLYWPRRSFLKKPGTILVQILPPIAPGLTRQQAMRELEARLEEATDRLVVAAGGPPTPRRQPKGSRAMASTAP